MWTKFKDKIKKKLNSKSGAQSLTLVIGVIISFIAIGGLADLTILQTKLSVLSSQTGYVSRTIADQGGVAQQEIDNYHGKYITAKELHGNVKAAMNYAGISDDEWVVYIAGHELTPATETPLYDYGEKIPISVSIEYGWPFTSNFVPGDMRNERTSRTRTLSTYMIRDSDFVE